MVWKLQYGLFAKLVSGEEKILMWNLEKQVLLFVEQEIERLFRIEDQEMKDEIVN